MSDEATPSYVVGFCVAAMEIAKGIASNVQAKERGLYVGDQDKRVEWDRGYAACVCAYRLGHNVQEFVDNQFYAESYVAMACVVEALLDGTWQLRTRADPRS